MIDFLRHLLAIAALPFVVTVVVPLWLARRADLTFEAGQSIPEQLLQFLGALSATVGIVLFIASLRHFAERGRGTLAPWDPPRHFVVSGPYRYVRNPMISGVMLILAGEALLLLSLDLAAWAAMFIIINLIYIPTFEEWQLARRFGEPYREYCRHVRRFVPRLRPWSPGVR
jgi:protein-S-isoprenylcysteine O-methyltransferase Ste14